MAYQVASGAILEATIRGRNQDQRILSLFHYRYISTSAPQDGVDVINTFNTKFNTAAVASMVGAFAAAAPLTAVFDEVVYQWVFPTRRARLVKSPARTAGLREDTLAPSNIGLFVEKLSDEAGRHGHGGLHWGYVGSSDYDGNNFTLGALTNMDNIRARMVETINLEFGIDMVPLIFNRTAPVNSIEVTGTVIKPGVRTMHRRTVGLGE